MGVGVISEIAKRLHCTHLHPGYGFLSELPSLAAALSQISICFVGPTVETLRIASDKMLSRLASSLGTRWWRGTGIRTVADESAVADAYKRCLRESPSQRLFVEKALIGPSWKHIEVQIVGDGSGAVTHLWERECSVQRRFQKIIAPSRLPQDMVQPLLHASLRLAQSLKYKGLGTFEFLLDTHTREWFFLEINPRVQVEHTVTEEVMGIDLVRVQLLLSLPGSTLSSVQLPAVPHPPMGAAIQLRITADEPPGFQLSTGVIQARDITWPSGPGIRIDTWLLGLPSFLVGAEFDSLLAKIIVRGRDFEESTQRAKRALSELAIRGEVKTNHSRTIMPLQDISTTPQPSNSPAGVLMRPGTAFHLTLSPKGSTSASKHILTLDSIGRNAFPNELSGTLQTTLSPTPLDFHITQSTSALMSASSFELADRNNPSHIASPLTGKVVELHPALLAAGEAIIVFSIMKMETVVTAPGDGIKLGLWWEGVLICIYSPS
ncbi:hypothetical protein BD779DRAFT_1613814 [Infundibulicybe gibba]|nr:hypothetical protein BD779DRAFT_1613814 [Infundibulicybe gibba]